MAARQHGRRRGKSIADPIHGFCHLQPLCVTIMDTLPFQRLRDLKQLGLTPWVYPSGCHTRFAHSLGVSHLAAEWSDQLLRRAAEEEGDHYCFRSPWMTLAAVAGLCHDLGHGPFSHTFESELLPSLGAARGSWHHEHMSCRLLEHTVDEGHIDLADYGLNPADLATIQSLMLGVPPPGAGAAAVELAPEGPCARDAAPPGWLWHLVANKRNSVDVDKMDYLMRDAHFVGVPLRVNMQRIRSCAKIVDDEVCYHHKAYGQLHQLFYDRAMMHRDVYTHATIRGIELMLCDALVIAEPLLRNASKVDDVQDFLGLTDDSLLAPLKCWDPDHCDNPALLRSAQAIWRRVQTRQLYRLVDEVVVPFELAASGHLPCNKHIAADLASIQAADGQVDLQPDDIIVSRTKIDFSLKDIDPRTRISFFSDDESSEARHGAGDSYFDNSAAALGCGAGLGAAARPGGFGSPVSGPTSSETEGGWGRAGAGTSGRARKFQIARETVSTLLNESYQELKLRVYCRRSDDVSVAVLARAFRAWGERVLPATKCGSSPFSTPLKQAPLPVHVPQRVGDCERQRCDESVRHGLFQ